MPTVNDAVVRTKRLLHSNTRTELNNFLTTSGETNSIGTGTSLSLAHVTDGIRAGSYISVSDGSNLPETMYVRSSNGVSIQVIRGVDGSATIDWASTDVATPATIEVEPRFTEHQILEAVRDAIRALPDNLYAVATTTASFSTTEQAQAITFSNGFNQVLSATRTARSGEDRLLGFNVKVQEIPATSTDSGTSAAYKLIRQENIEKAVTVNLTYAHPFVTGTLTLGIDLVSTVGMSAEMTDIPALGAAASLVLGEESLRLDLHSQGDSRSDAAVAAGDRARYSLVLQAQYDRRVSQEARRLMAKYGVRTGAAVWSVFPTTVR
tara:strand:- start:136 stop:1101 length:966 start_codon:yes stop_codon:yes gene_type:complete